MLKKQLYKAPVTEALEMAIEKNILFASEFNEDGNEIPNDNVLNPDFFEVF